MPTISISSHTSTRFMAISAVIPLGGRLSTVQLGNDSDDVSLVDEDVDINVSNAHVICYSLFLMNYECII